MPPELTEPPSVSGPSREGERLLTAREVAGLLRVTPAWIYAETRAGRLPHVRLGRYVRYRTRSIEQWIDDQEHVR